MRPVCSLHVIMLQTPIFGVLNIAKVFKVVCAERPLLWTTAIFVRLVGCRPMECSISMTRGSTDPWQNARYFLSMSLFLSCSARAMCEASFFAMMIRPLVKRSSRCIMPGFVTPLMPESVSLQCASKAFTKVPDRCPGAGCVTIPEGL